MDGAAGVTLNLVSSEGPAPRVLRLAIDPTRARHAADDVASALYAGNPAIAVGRDGEAILINPHTLREEDDGLVASRLGALLL